MAALIATAAMAVSVVVVGPGPAPVRHYWETPEKASFTQAVEQWASNANLARPEIDPRLATLSIGRVSVAGADVCDAVRKLVAALKYSDLKPELTGCGLGSGDPIVIGAALR